MSAAVPELPATPATPTSPGSPVAPATTQVSPSAPPAPPGSIASSWAPRSVEAPAKPVFPEAPFSWRVMRRLTQYGRLMRLDRPVGTWLLLWPTLWALWVAGAGRPKPIVLIVFVLGVVVMRAAGCVINDFADRDIDPYVRRTRDRPLAARLVTPREALALFVLLIGAALFLVTRLDELTVQLAAVGALLTISYPFVKRVFPMPQLYLGISFGGWGVPMAFAAQLGELPRVCWVLYIAAVIWAAMYDTLYAMIDREDDIKIGVKSSAILFADLDKLLIGVMQGMIVYALYLAGEDMHYGRWFQGGVIAAGLLFLWQQWLIRRRDPAGCLRAFLNNQYVGLAVFAGILLQYIYKS